MSAVIGILNKQAVALAADSAVTISGGGNRKIFNTANKIFTLSKYHPVAVMIYNSASFMGTPWEIIIKMYREQLGDKSFKKIEVYQKDFLKYLRSKNYFSDRDEEDGALTDFFLFWMIVLRDDIKDKHKKLFVNLSAKNKTRILEILDEYLSSSIKSLKKLETCADFKSYTLRAFSAYSKAIFDKCIEAVFDPYDLKFSDGSKLNLRRFLFYQMISKRFHQNFTGLIFTGYGDDQIYPQLIPVHVSFVLDDKLRFYVDDGMRAHITSTTNAVISPFAQIDVINTILSGIDP